MRLGFPFTLASGLVACGGVTDGSTTSVDGAAGLAASLGAGGALANGGASSGTGFPDVAGSSGSPNCMGGKTVAPSEILATIENAACAGTSLEIEVPPAFLEFVVDVSGSMNDLVAGSTQTKWQITQAALADAIGNSLPDNTGVGILFYPNMNTVPNYNTTPLNFTNCVNTSAMIPAAPLGPAGSQQRATIAQSLANVWVGGGAPMDDAYEYAYSYGIIPSMRQYGYFTPFMVLITDGQPTISLGCEGLGQTTSPVDWHPIVNDISAAFNNSPQVKTFIVGSPGSESQSSTGTDGRPWLSLAARTGGTPITPDCQDTGPNYCHFDMTQSVDFGSDLAAALSAIADSAIPCSVQIPPPSNGGTPDPNKISVIYEQNVVGGTPTQQWLIGQTCDITCAGGTSDGWYVDPSTSKIVLCPLTCKMVQSDSYAVVNVRQGCMSYIPFD